MLRFQWLILLEAHKFVLCAFLILVEISWPLDIFKFLRIEDVIRYVVVFNEMDVFFQLSCIGRGTQVHMAQSLPMPLLFKRSAT